MPVVQVSGLGDRSLHHIYPSKSYDKGKCSNLCNNRNLGTERPEASTLFKTNIDNGIQNNKIASNPLTKKKKKVLVVECEPDILLLKTYLEYMGLDTVTIENCDKYTFIPAGEQNDGREKAC